MEAQLAQWDLSLFPTTLACAVRGFALFCVSLCDGAAATGGCQGKKMMVEMLLLWPKLGACEFLNPGAEQSLSRRPLEGTSGRTSHSKINISP